MIGFDTFHRNYIASLILLTEGQFVGTTASRKTCANWLFAGRSDVSGVHLVFRDSKGSSFCLS